MNLGTAVTREQSSRIRLQRESSRPDLRQCFSPQRYPVRLCRSAQLNRHYRSLSHQPRDRAGPIHIPSVPLSSAAQSERGGSVGTSTPLIRRHSSVGRAPVQTLGETISQLSAVEVEQAKFLARHHSGRYSHAGLEDEYLMVRRRWREGADVCDVTPQRKIPSVRSHWHRPESVWRTFRTSQQIQLYPDVQCEVKGTKFELYRKCLRQLKNHQLWAEKRQSFVESKVT